MKIEKSVGVTASERMLAEFCENSFLKLWSYPNPYKDDGKELCDLVVVFEDKVLIFFDRTVDLPETSEKDPQVLWERWRKKAIDKQLNTARGAERYIRSGRPIFLDSKKQSVFPLSIDLATVEIHKIVVAHGAKEACLAVSESNVYGSLAISYSDDPGESNFPFMVNLDKIDPIHILDSHNLPIVLSELDTITDFTNYLTEKVVAIRRYDSVSYCGEEDLLAHYLLNLDKETQQHKIGTKDPRIDSIGIGEGEWRDFIVQPVYQSTKAANASSYRWDSLLQWTAHNALKGTLEGDSPFLGRTAISEMAKESRFSRRAICEMMRTSILEFPDREGLSRKVSLMPSADSKKAYVLLQLKAPPEILSDPEYREKRQTLLETACGAAKNKLPHLETIVGIGIDAPKFSSTGGEHFMLLDCKDWPPERALYYEDLNRPWAFFRSPSLKQTRLHATEFVHPPSKSVRSSRKKVGRNEKCPCGSGEKYKRCHGRTI
jgi:hypothetical protein